MTNLKSFTPEGLQFGWDATSIKAFETCPRYYFYKHIEGWQPRRKSVHLIFGGHYAKALESYHAYVASGFTQDEAVREVIAELMIETWNYPSCVSCSGTGEAGPNMTCAECGGDGYVAEGGAPWQSDHNTKTRENLVRTVVWYLDQFGSDDNCKTLILSSGKAAVEHSFQIDMDNGIVYAGHMDRVVEYGHKIYVQDQKTTGTTITPRFFEQFNPDTQMSGYTFAGKALFGIPIHGVMIDGAQIAVGFSRFERGFTFRDEGQLNEWYDTTMHTVLRAQEATRENFFPMNAQSCGNYGGCQFRNVCSRSPHVREQFLKADFEKQPRWDPLQAR